MGSAASSSAVGPSAPADDIDAARAHFAAAVAGLTAAYEDADFPATAASLSPKATPSAPSWCRPAAWNREHATLFGEGDAGISVTNVLEGALADCYLAAASIVLCQRPDLVRALFVGYDAERGVAAVRLFRDGRWHVTAVDDRLPCARAGAPPLYGKCRDPSTVWLPLLEKAYAKGAFNNNKTKTHLSHAPHTHSVRLLRGHRRRERQRGAAGPDGGAGGRRVAGPPAVRGRRGGAGPAVRRHGGAAARRRRAGRVRRGRRVGGGRDADGRRPAAEPRVLVPGVRGRA